MELQMQSIGSTAQAGLRTSSHAQTWIAAVIAALVGGFLLWGVGFSHSEVLHNAAHDARHSIGFPCH